MPSNQSKTNMTRKISQLVWEESMRLVCPCLRYNKEFNMWIALKEDPCPTKKCKTSNCQNFGRPSDNIERLIIFTEVK